MARHYVKILSRLRAFAEKVRPGTTDWERDVFLDLTAGGRELRAVPLYMGYRGPVVGLCGEAFFCEAVQDERRRDCIFVFRIESADQRLPRVPPRSFRAEYLPLDMEQNGVPNLDGTEELFAIVERQQDLEPATAAAGDAPLRSLPPARASAPLERMLERAQEPLRRKWRPGVEVRQDLDEAALLEELQRIWSRFRLDKYAEVPPRNAGLLKGLIRPKKLGEEERRQLLGHFDLALLNAFVRDGQASEQSLFLLLEQIADLELSKPFRAEVWCQMLPELEPNALRRELHHVADALASLPEGAARFWERPLTEALRRAAQRSGDTRLAKVLEEADEEASPLGLIAEWAATLQFSSPELGPGGGEAPSPGASEVGGSGEPSPPEAAPPWEQPEPGESGSEPTPAATELPAATPAREAFERWVLRLRVHEPTLFEGLSREVRNALDSLRPLASDLDTVERVQQLVWHLRALEAQAAHWLQVLPDPEQLEADRSEALGAYSEAHQLLGDALGELLQRRVAPADLREISRMLRQRRRLEALPGWLWAEDEEACEQTEGQTAPPPLEELCRRLVAPGLRRRIQWVLERADDLGDEALALLTQLPPPPPGEDIEVHVETALEQLRHTRQALRGLSPEYHGWLDAGLSEGVDVGRLLRAAQDLDRLRERVSPAAFAQIAERVAEASDHDEREERLQRYEAAVSFLESVLQTAKDARFEQIDRCLKAQPPVGARPASASPAQGPPRLTLDHNWVDRSGQRVPLQFSGLMGSGRPYGVVTAPLLLQTDEPRDVNLRLQLEMKSDQRKGWPAEWEDHSPQELSLSRFHWRSSDGRTFVHSFRLRLPLREPRHGEEPLEFTLRAYDAASGEALSPPKKFRWLQVERPEGRITFEWQDGINTQYVQRHPVGPQQERERILARLEAGSSFAVIAPRRFGKSTLVEYLREQTENADLLILPPLLCTGFHDGSALDAHRLWAAVSAELEARLGVGLSGGLHDNLPRPEALDSARAAAWEAGKRTLVLLFDEAQLFFPSSRGYLLGDRLKDLLERHWSRADQEGMARVLLGFIGLPSLQERAGTNLMALLRPIERSEFRESDLNSLVLGVTQGRLHTTREARVRLAERAGNLFVLRTLLDRLVEHVNEESRNWASYDDVLFIESNTKKSLAEGGELNLAAYMRDVLNEAENVSQWRPKPSYPVAVALARAEREGYRDPEQRIEAARGMLDRWCGALHAEHGNRLIYTRERIDEHLGALRDMDVLAGVAFKSELLGAWLAGVARPFPRDEDDRQALFRGAMERIRQPQGLEPVHEGGQAKVFRFTEQGVEYALRKVPLANPEDRRRFLDAVDALTKLKRRIHLREEGADYIFDLRDIGLADADEGLGVEIYRWIDGLHLGKKLGQLRAPLVADLGLKLARALRLLHRHEILHRDVCPRNIILSDAGSKPVLVDFGLSRLGTAGEHRLGDCAAPETRGPRAAFTPAADIFGLGRTLQTLLEPEERRVEALQTALLGCDAPTASLRPAADELVQRLERAADELRVVQVQEQVWATILRQAGRDLEKSWFRQVLEKLRPRIGALALGLHSDEYDRCAEIAAFLDQVLEAYPGAALKLGFVKNPNEVTGDRLATAAVTFLHGLRLDNAHFLKEDRRQRLMVRFQHPSAEQIRTWTLEGARSIGDALSLPSLFDVVRALL